MSDKDLNNEIDDLLNDFDFKPITEGLGFHHSLKEKKEVQVNLKNRSASLKDDLEVRATSLKNSNPTKPQNTSSVNMGELSVFYNQNEDNKIKEELDISVAQVAEPQVTEVSILARMVAWCIDLIMITAIMLITITGILVSSEMPLEIINIFMLSDDLLFSFISLSVLFYTFYFTFLDKTNYSTPGKRMMSLQVTSTSGRLSIFQTLLRSLISVCSLGLLNLLGLQDKLTNTKVIVSK